MYMVEGHNTIVLSRSIVDGRGIKVKYLQQVDKLIYYFRGAI